MKTCQRYVWMAVGVGLFAAVLSATSDGPAIAQTSDGVAALAGSPAKLNCDTRPCDAVARGRRAFNNRTFKRLGGNGRTCADCHMPSEGFQLSPAAARARFDALQAKRARRKKADDPLFRPVDADDFRVNGDQASDFSNLVENGLVRVTMPLPLNVKLIDAASGQPSDETSVDLWRAVMPVFNVAITGPDFILPMWPPGAPRVPIMDQDPNGPNRQGGYQHDARFATLQEQARGALFAHAQVTLEPRMRVLDDLAAFQQTLFSSAGVEQLAQAILSGSTFPDPDPALRAARQSGLQPRVRPVPRRFVAPEHVDARGGHRAADRALSKHRDRLSAAGDRRLRAVSAAARAQRAHVPDHARQRHHPDRHDLGSGAIAAHGPTGGPRDDGHHQSARHQQDRTVLSQQLGRDARGSGGPLRRLVRASGPAESAAEPAADSLVDRPRRRSRIRSGGGAGGVAGVPAKALAARASEIVSPAAIAPTGLTTETRRH